MTATGLKTHNHLVCKQKCNHLSKLAKLAKRLIVSLRIKLLWVRVPLQSFRKNFEDFSLRLYHSHLLLIFILFAFVFVNLLYLSFTVAIFPVVIHILLVIIDILIYCIDYSKFFSFF